MSSPKAQPRYKVIFRFTKGTTYVRVIQTLNNTLIYSISTGQLKFISKIRKSSYAHIALTKDLGRFLYPYKMRYVKKQQKKLKILVIFKGLDLGKGFVRQNLKRMP